VTAASFTWPCRGRARTYRRISVRPAVARVFLCCRVILPDQGVMSPSQHSASPCRQPFPGPSEAGPAVTQDLRAATLILMVGLPAAGKTTRAKELAAAHKALRLTPDHWMIPLFGDPMAGGQRWVLEGRLISIALQALRLGTSVVLDYGLWGRDERSALRWLARSAGAACQVVYLPVDKDVQLARRPHRTPPRNGTAPDIPDDRG